MHVMHNTYAHLLNRDRTEDMDLLERPTATSPGLRLG